MIQLLDFAQRLGQTLLKATKLERIRGARKRGVFKATHNKTRHSVMHFNVRKSRNGFSLILTLLIQKILSLSVDPQFITGPDR